jgi:hypothetical protein
MAMPLGVAGEFRVCEYVILKKKRSRAVCIFKIAIFKLIFNINLSGMGSPNAHNSWRARPGCQCRGQRYCEFELLLLRKMGCYGRCSC